MTRFVLGIKDLDRLHVGETDDFIQRIGSGAKPNTGNLGHDPVGFGGAQSWSGQVPVG